MANVYVSSVDHAAVAQWSAGQAVSIGAFRRQLAAPTAGNERVFRCTTAGTTGGSEPSWTLTAGATTNDNGVVWTEVTGLATYGWTAAAARINSLPSGRVTAGDTILVGSDHSENWSAASPIIAPPTSASAITKIVSVDRTTGVLTPGATVQTTGAFAPTIGNSVSGLYVYGITIICGATSSSNLSLTCGGKIELESCDLVVATTGSSSNIATSLGANVTLVDCKVKFSASGHSILATNATVIIRSGNTPRAFIDTAGSVPTNLFTGNGSEIDLDCKGVDFTGVTGNLFSSGSGVGTMRFTDCTLDASTTTPSLGANSNYVVVFNNLDTASCNTNYRSGKSMRAGSETHETTIVRTGGASDGTTPQSRKIVTTANCHRLGPFRSSDAAIWCDGTGVSKTITVYGVWGGGAVPNNDEIWIEALYLGDSASPKGSVIRSCPADVLTAGSAVPSDTSAWGGSTTPFKMSVTFTPQKKGWVFLNVCVGRASSTFYVDLMKPDLV